MAYEKFENINFRDASLATIQRADEIIKQYREDYNMGLTLRQLYYQFVARDWMANTERNYKNLGVLITKGRKAGLIDWDGIHDEGRDAKRRRGDQSPTAVVNRIETLLIMNPWRRQDAYVEVWIEKHGMAGTIKTVCNKHRVTYLTCGGYVSSSEAYKGGKRFKNALEKGKKPILIHLGDHDPSGIDMTRDNASRIEQFGNFGDDEWGFEDLLNAELDIRRIALNIDQVREHNPPPNPAKMTDTRADDYIAEFGASSWELDALSPNIIRDLLDAAILDCVTDSEEYHATFDREEKAKEHLRKLYPHWNEVTQFLDAHEIDEDWIMNRVQDVIEREE